jgi:hypothetical protein
VLPTWNHLWFVVYLWVYTMALGLVLLAGPALFGLTERLLAPAFAGVMLLVVPSLLFTAYRLFLYPDFPSTHALFGDWYNHAQSATAFLIGFLPAHSAAFWQAVERQRWIALIVAVALYAVFISLRSVPDGGMPLRIVFAVAYGCYQWLCMVAVLGFARRWLNRDSPVRRYLTDAIFPYYIVHQTAIIMIAHALQGSGLSAPLEASIVIGGTAASCVAAFEIVRRVGWLRPLFGLKRNEAASVAVPGPGTQPAH